MITNPKKSKTEEFLFLTSGNESFLHSVRKMNSNQHMFAVLRDFESIRNGLLFYSSLKDQNVYDTLNKSIDISILEILKKSSACFDHVGFEVFGSLREYTNILEDLILERPCQFKLFESVQLYKILKKYDAHLKKIDILRVVTKNGNNIELFSCHQHYSKTLFREENIYLGSDNSGFAFLPFAHIAVRVYESGVFEKIVQAAEKNSSEAIFGEGVYYNPSDNSYNIKLITRDFNQCGERMNCIFLIEFIFHSPSVPMCVRHEAV